MDDRVVGVAQWVLPANLSRSETLVQFLYRRGIEYKDHLEDWVFPATWAIPERSDEYRKARVKCAEKFLGLGNVDKMWYLKTLVVHPEFQRKGVGGRLIDWGLNQAQERGEGVYVEADGEAGKGLYLKKGFKVVGLLVVGEKDDQLVDTCMLWDLDTSAS
jgi:ribosomal protein S18 acetylase RimI-like enzyme